MAGDWIKMRMDLPEDPAVYRLARITGLDRLSVVGRLYAFWAWADRHAVDGVVDGASTHDLNDIVKFNGFAEAMIQVKWLEVSGESLVIPKHDRHNGESAKERSLKNARQAKWRKNVDANVDAKPSTQATTKPSTEASTREEKRREEIYTPGFVEFWSAWPRSTRKGEQGKCFAVWKKSDLESKSQEIISHVEAMKKSRQWLDGYEPAPLVYLNGGKWEGAELPELSKQPAHHASWT